MSTRLTADNAKQSLTAHAAARGLETHQKYGPRTGWTDLLRLLDDRACVRYPCEILFDASALFPGEFAFPAPKGERPEDGFTLHVHPHFAADLDQVPFLALYHLAAINYGVFASADDAETFAAAALGLEKEDYYLALCRLADQLNEPGCA